MQASLFDTGLFRKGMDTAGGLVDRVFLSSLKAGRPFVTRIKKDPALYARQVEWLVSRGYVDDPRSFFRLPDAAPVHAVVRETRWRGGTRQVISWDSGYEPRNPRVAEEYLGYENNRSAWMVRWTHGRPDTNTVLCLHGFMLGEPNQAEEMFKVARMFDMGLDVALYIAPFHWRRGTGASRDKAILLQPDNAVFTLEGFGQSMWDLGSTMHVLRGLGAADIGLIGASLGGYNSALYSCLARDHVFAAMMVPAVTFRGVFFPGEGDMPKGASGELREQIRAVWDIPSPLGMEPLLPPDRILVVASRGDRLCPFPHVAELCEKWGWPEHHFLAGGHWMMFDASARGRAWYSFLERSGLVPEGEEGKPGG
ncbi:MAG: hypothetical protein ACLFOY_17240 [Desulfatibacillaceae bacterium]